MKRFALAAFAAASMMTGSAQAATVFQSLPNLNVAPETNAWCSSCSGTYKVYDTFSLGNPETLKQLTFAVMTGYNFPSTVDVGFYTVTPFGLPGTSLANYSFKVSDFLSTVNTSFGTSLVTVALPNLSLGAGTYDISFYNGTDLGIPGYAKAGGAMYQQGYGFHRGEVAGFSLSNSAAPAVPEPATWAMMLVGFGTVGFALRRRKARTAVSFG